MVEAWSLPLSGTFGIEARKGIRLSPVSDVTATRQVSILMGVGLGSLVLGEEAGLVRLTVAGLIIVGILLIALRG